MLTFCIRDDDTSFFTSPEQLEGAYGEFWGEGPVSLAIVPFQKGCRTKGIPDTYWHTGEIYPLGDNTNLVQYLREQIGKGHIEIMLHGYHHEDFPGGPEFYAGSDLAAKVITGKEYLERLLETRVRVFTPPHNSISRSGLAAVQAAGLQLGLLAGLRQAWSMFSCSSWINWWRIKNCTLKTGLAYPFVVDLGTHREVMAHSVTPRSILSRLRMELEQAALVNGVFCLATHYWEFDRPPLQPGAPTVRQQVYDLLNLARSQPEVKFSTLGDVLAPTGA